MRKLLILLLTCTIVSCSSPSLEKVAKKQCTILLTEVAKDPSSVKLTNFRTVYQTDSLCILHAVFTAKNGLGVETSDDIEYIYYVGNDNNVYESYLDLSEEDSIFVNEQDMQVVNRYTFYKDLDYKDAIKQRVINQLNTNGRVVGNKELNVNIEPIINIGQWELKYYKDEFGEYSNNKYLVLVGTGVFSNSATTNSEMSAILFVDKTSVSMRLVEYSSLVVKDDDKFNLKIKDNDGSVTRFEMYNSESGYMYFTNSSYFGQRYNNIITILDKEGIIRCNGIMSNSYSSSSYTFSFDLNGYKEAMKYIN